MEVFKDVIGYKGCYEVSNIGRVRSLKFGKERILSIAIGNRGYKKVSLFLEGRRKDGHIHQMMAESFMGHVKCGLKIVVDHIDNDPLNNTISNLQLISNRENTSKDRKGGESKYIGVYRNKVQNKWFSSIWTNGRLKHIGTFNSELSAHIAYQKELILINK